MILARRITKNMRVDKESTDKVVALEDNNKRILKKINNLTEKDKIKNLEIIEIVITVATNVTKENQEIKMKIKSKEEETTEAELKKKKLSQCTSKKASKSKKKEAKRDPRAERMLRKINKVREEDKKECIMSKRALTVRALIPLLIKRSLKLI